MRLDGSSKISERRDMVADFQARSVIKAKLKNGDLVAHRFVMSF
jgi:SNF2 family DNA or RNA helicase